MASGKDPSVDLQRASQSLRRALELLPDFAPAYNKLATCTCRWSQSRKRGRDVYEDFGPASGTTSAIQLSPESLLPYTNLIAISSHRLISWSKADASTIRCSSGPSSTTGGAKPRTLRTCSATSRLLRCGATAGWLRTGGRR